MAKVISVRVDDETVSSLDRIAAQVQLETGTRVTRSELVCAVLKDAVAVYGAEVRASGPGPAAFVAFNLEKVDPTGDS